MIRCLQSAVSVLAAWAIFTGTAQWALAGQVKLTVEEPSGVLRQGWPVTSGIPFAQGALADPRSVALKTDDGRHVPLQTEVLARWLDGSIRWLLVDFQVDLEPGQRKTLTFEYSSAEGKRGQSPFVRSTLRAVLANGDCPLFPGVKPAAVLQPIQAKSQGGGVEILTGPMRLVLRSSGFRLLDGVWLDADRSGDFSDDERVTASDGAGIVLTAPDGKQFRADLARAKIELEQAGPLRACVRIEGEHASDGGKMFRYVVRLHAFRGQPFVRMFYTFVNDRTAQEMSSIAGLDLVFATAGPPPPGLVLDGKTGAGGRLFQVDELGYQIDQKPAGKRAAGWAAAAGPKAGLAVGVRQFWQNWPKGLVAQPGRIEVGLCPKFAKGLYDGRPLLEEAKLYYYLRDGLYRFKLGVARTHELWATFFPGAPDAKRLGAFFQAAEEPLVATCEPAYACATKALGDFPPADPARYFGYDAWFDQALNDHLKRRDRDRFYGMLNYGDWWGERGVNWGNLEYDLGYCFFVQYLRTGRREFFLRAEEAARHHIDVDVIHAEDPKKPRGPRTGEIWAHSVGHTGGYYLDAPLPASNTYQRGWNQNQGHVWVEGDFAYYHLSGDRRARDVALTAADTMARQCPTAYGDHIRAIGWPMVLVLAAYESTGDKKYLEAATKNWEVLKKHLDWKRGWVVRLAKGRRPGEGHCRHTDSNCEGNVPFMEGLTCSALARYHRLTGNPEVLKAIGVGIDQMVRECWLEESKAFRYTACPLTSVSPALLPLSAEAMAYEGTLTGNREHLRVLREGVRCALEKVPPRSGGAVVGIITHFTPFALQALDGR